MCLDFEGVLARSAFAASPCFLFFVCEDSSWSALSLFLLSELLLACDLEDAIVLVNQASMRDGCVGPGVSKKKPESENVIKVHG